jgi:hypothetical protein
MELSKQERKNLKAQQKLLKASRETSLVQKNINPININDQEILTVVCVRFGTGYGREYVERLRNMVTRNLTIPHEFVCLTDDQHPISGVRSIVQSNANYRKQWWHKVHLFDSKLPLRGRILYLDLDVIIFKKIDKLVLNLGTEFFGIRDFNRKFHSGWQQLNSSAMTWVHGTQSEIYEKFIKDPNGATRLHGDQDWIWKIAKGNLKFWPDRWIQSYKWEIRQREDLVSRDGRKGFKTVKEDLNIDHECCVAVFHGYPNPADVQDKIVVDNWR